MIYGGDEAYSIKKAYLPISRLILVLAENDVHPPLYFVLVHLGYLLCNLLCIPVVYMLKIISIIPYAIILLWIIPAVRKMEGDHVAGLFSICVIGMPQMAGMGITIRMYSWCALFILGIIIEMYRIWGHENSIKNWWIMVLCSLCAAFSHYFSCIAVAILWCMLLCYLLKNREWISIRRWFVFGVFTICMYIPWLIVLLKQTGKVSQGWWVGEISFSDINDWCKFIFGHWALLLIFAGVYLFGLIKKEHFHWLVLAGPSVLLGDILIGVIISKVIRPVFVIRYAFPCILAMWLGFCTILGQSKKRIVQISALILCISIGMYNVIALTKDELTRKSYAQDTYEIMTTLPENTVFIGGCGDVGMVNALYDFEVYCLPLQANQPAIDKLQEYVFSMKTLKQWDEIANLIQHKNVYFIGNGEYEKHEKLIEEFVENGGKVTYTNCIWFDSKLYIYRMDI